MAKRIPIPCSSCDRQCLGRRTTRGTPRILRLSEVSRSAISSEPVCLNCSWQHQAAILRCDTVADLEALKADPSIAARFLIDSLQGDADRLRQIEGRLAAEVYASRHEHARAVAQASDEPLLPQIPVPCEHCLYVECACNVAD